MEFPMRFKDGDRVKDNDNDDDDDEEVDETGYKTVRDAVLFAVEVSPSMLKEPQVAEGKRVDNTSPIIAALKCAIHLMQQRIISSPKDLMGILLYGTELSKFYKEDETTRGGWSYPNCYLFVDLDVPEADDVKALKNLVEKGANSAYSKGEVKTERDEDVNLDEDRGHGNTIGEGVDDDLAKRLLVPSSKPVSMHSVLFCANQIFQQKASNFTSRRLFIVTDNDSPHAEDKGLRSQATVRAKDLYDLGVVIELFPISTSKHTFDTKLFWDDIVYKGLPSDPDAILHNPPALTDVDKSKITAGGQDGITLLQSLLTTISSRATPKRALFSAVPLEIGPGFRISVKGYLLYKHQKPVRSTYIYLGGEKPEIVKGQTTMFADDTDGAGGSTRPVQKAEVRKAYTFGGEQITFSQDEMKKLRDFGDPIIRIIGFKPFDRLPIWANFKTSTFLYPSEEDYVGSSRVFSALHHKLTKDKLYALVWFVPRRNAVPVMAGMVPTLPSSDDASNNNGGNLAGVSATGTPQGLHLIPLPFADDIRQNPTSIHDKPLRAPDELTDLMRPIVQQLNLPKGVYDPSRYPNPSLQWHYRILQALALDEDLPEQPEDRTRPKYRQIDKRICNEAVAWGQALDNLYKEHLRSNPAAANAGSKRLATTGSVSKSHADTALGGDKRAKAKASGDVGGGGGSVDDTVVRKLFEQGKVSALTVPQLKDFCTSKKLPVTGKKADIVERVETYFERK